MKYSQHSDKTANAIYEEVNRLMVNYFTWRTIKQKAGWNITRERNRVANITKIQILPYFAVEQVSNTQFYITCSCRQSMWQFLQE